MMKETIFIGSSSEALEVVNEVEKLLKNNYNILRWDTSFNPNQSTLDSLIENAIKVDKAIFIGTADDIVEDVQGKRGQKIKHRDNVVFEFGLFLGMLGRKDCLYLVEQTSIKDIMTDYLGVTVIPFNKTNLSESIPISVNKVKEYFNKYSTRDINLFPSVSLASAYYVNFIQPIFSHYINNNFKITSNRGSYDECIITIILPSTISNDINQQSAISRSKFQTREESIDHTIGRGRKIIVDVTSSNKKLKIIDFPTITTAIYHAVYALLPNEHIKVKPDYGAIFERELQRFAEALELFIKESPCSKHINVQIKKEDAIIVDIPAKTPTTKDKLLSYLKKIRIVIKK